MTDRFAYNRLYLYAAINFAPIERMKGTMDINQFFVAGINYKKSDALIRGAFAVNPQQYAAILAHATKLGLTEVFVLSTCNRTEIYGIAPSVNELIQLLCSETKGSLETFTRLCYTKQGVTAVTHLFEVAAGLDSQILGDYEIIGQIKQSARLAKEAGCMNTFSERLLGYVLQASKEIKTQTALSGGTVSISFAAIQFLKSHIKNIEQKKIVVLGTGKIGRNTCHNLVDYLHTKNITLINRSPEKAFALADALGLSTASYDDMQQQVKEADVVIVATNATEPVIYKNDLLDSGKKVLIDLSIPNNIEPSVKELPHITLANVDALTEINDAALQKRVAEVPKAKAIINEHKAEFINWYNMRKNVVVIKAVKQKLIDMHQCKLYLSVYPNKVSCTENYDAANIQKVINNMASKMRSRPLPGCNYIEALNDFMGNSAN